MICPNCGTEYDSEYCPACGQHREAARLLPLRALAAETMSEVLSLDSRVARTLRLLLLHPGEATLRYIAGQRQPYVPPLRFYLVVSAISIFIMAMTGFLSLEFMLGANERDVTTAVEALGGDARDPLFMERFEAHYGTIFPIANLFSPIFLALALKILYPREYLHAHFVFALHAWSTIILIGTPLLLLTRLNQSVVTTLLFLFSLTYLFLAQRRVYRGRSLVLGLKYAALVVAVLITTQMISTAAFVAALILAARG